MSNIDKQLPSVESHVEKELDDLIFVNHLSEEERQDIIDSHSKFAKEVVKYTLEQAAEKCSLIVYDEEWENDELKLDEDTKDGHYTNPWLGRGKVVTINDKSILSLESQIIKDLGL